MGKSQRQRPARLAEKLRQIRESFGLSQSGMLARLGAEEQIDYTTISKYELGKNEPPLMILLEYARVAGVHVEALIDDALDLPEKLPGPVRYGMIARSYRSRGRGKKH
jgi:transcriptional regulator with XRE-family HTH domain